MEVKHCRSCHTEIVWLRTSTGNLVPVNADTATEDDSLFDKTRHVAHFSTCPQSKQWSRKAKKYTPPTSPTQPPLFECVIELVNWPNGSESHLARFTGRLDAGGRPIYALTD